MTSASSGTVRIGVIGAGIMGRRNAATLAAHPGVSVTATASRTRAHSAELADELAGYGKQVTVLDSDTALLDSGLVDAVAITTPDHLHADVVVAAAERGLHVLVEKPFTTDVAGADRAVAAIRRAGVTAMCLFNHRWVPAYAQAKEEMAALGAPIVARARAVNAAGHR